MDNFTEIEFILYVSDQNRSRDFYSFLLDKKPVLDVPGMTEFVLGTNVKLGLMPEKGIAKILGDKTLHPELGSGIPRCELYLKVKKCSGIHVTCQEIKHKNHKSVAKARLGRFSWIFRRPRWTC